MIILSLMNGLGLPDRPILYFESMKNRFHQVIALKCV
jgi:hypothetical protein